MIASKCVYIIEIEHIIARKWDKRIKKMNLIALKCRKISKFILRILSKLFFFKLANQ
jgi:hypothetical protein